SLKNIGLKCCERSFTRWFKLNFPNYDHKWNRSYPEPLRINKPQPKITIIPLPKILSIYVVNPDYGVSKDTGKCSEKRQIVDTLLSKVPLLTIFRKLYVDFRNILKGGCPDQLDKWMKEVQSIGRKKMDRFCRGLQKDIQAVKNAIIYNWTNGLVEGNVNRLKK